MVPHRTAQGVIRAFSPAPSSQPVEIRPISDRWRKGSPEIVVTGSYGVQSSRKRLERRLGGGRRDERVSVPPIRDSANPKFLTVQRGERGRPSSNFRGARRPSSYIGYGSGMPGLGAAGPASPASDGVRTRRGVESFAHLVEGRRQTASHLASAELRARRRPSSSLGKNSTKDPAMGAGDAPGARQDLTRGRTSGASSPGRFAAFLGGPAPFRRVQIREHFFWYPWARVGDAGNFTEGNGPPDFF